MTDETRAKVENRVLQIAKLADEICDGFTLCNECPLYENKCTVSRVCGIAYEIQYKREQEPTYEELPIDLDDDNHCDECCKPTMNGCYGRGNLADDCPYDLGECCEDNLATNVGRICFEHNLPTNFAMAIIEIIQKERDRNEYLHLYRKHFPAE